MNIEEQIKYGKMLLAQLHDGKAISKEDKNWLRMNPVYSDKYGYPVVMMDIIHIKSDTKYLFRDRRIHNG